MEDGLRLMSSVISSGEHGHILCMDIVRYHRNRILQAAKHEIKSVKGFSEGKN